MRLESPCGVGFSKCKTCYVHLRCRANKGIACSVKVDGGIPEFVGAECEGSEEVSCTLDRDLSRNSAVEIKVDKSWRRCARQLGCSRSRAVSLLEEHGIAVTLDNVERVVKMLEM
jgi:hypothetical protein